MRVFLPSRDDTRHHRRRNASKEGGIFFFGLPFLSSSPFRQVFFLEREGKKGRDGPVFFFVCFFPPLFCFLDWRRSSKGEMIDRLFRALKEHPHIRESRPTKAWQKSFLAEGTSGTGDERDEDEEDDDEECLHYRVRAPTATASLGRSRRRRPRRARSNDDRENNNNNNNNNDDDDDDVIDIARRRTRIKRPMGTHRTDERRCSER